VLACPFCGAPETDRFTLEGRRFLVFRCLFSPEVDATLSDAALERLLVEVYREGTGAGYFRQMCDRLHLYVTQGAGARALGAAPGEPDAGAKP
jgi:hypothetical protein